MSNVMLCQGDALRLPLRDACVQCVVCSPPYWNLRDYGTAQWLGGDPACDHQEAVSLRRDSPGGFHNSTSRGTQPATHAGTRQYRTVCRTCGAKRHDQQLGMEALHDCLAWARSEPPCDIPCYICQMRRVFAECWRVLRTDGTLWCNIADSYNAAGRTGHGTRIGYKQGTNRASAAGADACRPTAPGLKEKDLCGIPHRLALALQADGWYWRSEIIWHKPNPMPESVTDRPSKAHEQVFLFSKQPGYFYDAEAIKETAVRAGDFPGGGGAYTWAGANGHNKDGLRALGTCPVASSRNARTVWAIPSEPTPFAHFATMPTALAARCILAGSSTRCCPQCYTPYQRQVEKLVFFSGTGRKHIAGGDRTIGQGWEGTPRASLKISTTGFAPTCSCITHALADGCRDSQHMDWLSTAVPSLVLDPFSGSGTTVLTARALGRHGVGVELSWEYLKLSRERLGLTALARWQGSTDSTPVTTTYEGLPLFTAPEESI